MPTYEYECPKHGYSVEVVHKMSFTPGLTCPKCKGKLEIVFTTPNVVIFKGEGWDRSVR